MQSPFKVFRKHQKVILAGLTLMAMIGFGLGDIFYRMGRFGSSAQGSTNVVDTNIGGLSQIEMQNLVFRRQNLQRFLAVAWQRSHEDLKEKEPFLYHFGPQRAMGAYGFGGASRPELLFMWLHRHEARKMGIVVTDRQIEDYIATATDHRLTSRMFGEIVDEMRISPKQLFDSFRDELQADAAYRMKRPPDLPAPEKYWEYYRQLRTREKIEVASLPVSDFAASVPEPAEAKIAALFEKHKADFELSRNAEFKPGFRQPQKVKLHYLSVNPSAVEDALKTMGPVTDREIEEYYERNKDKDLRMHEFEAPGRDESEPIDPEFAPDKGPALEGESKEKPDEDGAKPQEEKSGPNEKAKQKEEGKDKAPEEGKDSECLPATVSEDAEAETSEQPAAAADKAAKSDSAPPPKIDPKKKFQPPKIKYKPLDDNLREQIRDSVVNDRRKMLLKELTAKAVKALQDVGLSFATSPDIKLNDPNPAQVKEIERRSEEELLKIADRLGMKFGRTGLVSMQELGEIEGLGKAVEPLGDESLRQQPTTIIEQAFGSTALCRVFQSEGQDSTTYVCWKVQDVPLHIPTLDEPGIREQVVKAWKRLEALPLAKKRAEELAAKARGSDKEFTEALGGETVTGDPKGPAVTVSGPSPEFSFYEESSVPQSMRGQAAEVRLGNPIVVNNAGRKFMQVVFDALGEGDVGAALNDDASVYYVVKVVSRREPDREAFKSAPLFDRMSAYAQVAQKDREHVLSEYTNRLGEKYAIKWNDVAIREMGPMSDEE
ncbi:MAG: hypothetical protein ACM3U2_19050 [Deltaproteobacteria bacterium]